MLQIFHFFRGDPAQLLKSVNPGEAGILDSASKCHIRFRLGGDVRNHFLMFIIEIPTFNLLQNICSWFNCGYQRFCTKRLCKNKERKEKTMH